MYESLPPLQLLLAFEAAARHCSFKRTAEEMHLTASAVSQQIRALEESLGVTLFHRRHREVALTSIGTEYADLVRDTLRALERDTQRLKERQQRILRVSTEAYLAHELIVPNMADFRQRAPEVDLRVETSMALVDVRREPIDVAIRLTAHPPDEPGLWCTCLQQQSICLVAAPQVAAEIEVPYGLATAPIVCIENRYDKVWGPVGAYLGESIQPQSLLLVDSYYAMVRAAERGQGVAFGLRPSLDPWLKEGRLVEIPTSGRPVPHAFYLICRAADATRPDMQAFVEWIRERFDAARCIPDYTPPTEVAPLPARPA